MSTCWKKQSEIFNATWTFTLAEKKMQPCSAGVKKIDNVRDRQFQNSKEWM